MTLEMRKTLLFIGVVCILLVLVEELFNNDDLPSAFKPRNGAGDLGLDRAGLASDTLAERVNQEEEVGQNTLWHKENRPQHGDVVAFEEEEGGDHDDDEDEDDDDDDDDDESREAMERNKERKEEERDVAAQKNVERIEEGAGLRVKVFPTDQAWKSRVGLNTAEDMENVIYSDLKKKKTLTRGEDVLAGRDGEREVDEELDEEEDILETKRLQKSPYIVNEALEQKRESIVPNMARMKTISEWHRLTPYTHSFKRCRYNMCRWEKDNTVADALLFRAAAIRTWIIKPFPRKPGQRWIMYTNDPAVKNYGLERDDVGLNFNATSTYQLHSDYFRPFGQLRRVKPPVKNYERIFDGKKKQIAWFVSHCNTWSKRELYIERMRKIIPVDVFGACGNLTCGGSHYRGNDTNLCLPMLSQDYKFYLAFENSFCKDYVSEKFFKLFQGVDVVPVVQGGFDYHKYMPSSVFIDSSDFKTPEILAKFLLDLSKDKHRYVKMLKRKARWTSKSGDPLHCLVCEKLHTETRNHFHTDMVAAFNGKPSECYGPRWLQKAEDE